MKRYLSLSEGFIIQESDLAVKASTWQSVKIPVWSFFALLDLHRKIYIDRVEGKILKFYALLNSSDNACIETCTCTFHRQSIVRHHLKSEWQDYL